LDDTSPNRHIDTVRTRYGHFITVHWVVIVLTTIVVSGPVCNNLVAVQGVVLPLFTGTTFLATEHITVYCCSPPRTERLRHVDMRLQGETEPKDHSAGTDAAIEERGEARTEADTIVFVSQRFMIIDAFRGKVRG
jgi:hypothetical protein